MPNQKQSPLGEISAIRDILMGEQMVQYNDRFDQLESRVNAMEKDFNQKLDELEKRQAAALQAFREETANRLASLEQQLNTRANTLEEKINTVSESDRVKLGQMLRDLGQQLSGDGH